MDFGSKFTYLSSGEEEEEVKESTVDRRSDESSDDEDDGEVKFFLSLNTAPPTPTPSPLLHVQAGFHGILTRPAPPSRSLDGAEVKSLAL